jgi:hypothetical protein
VTVSAPIVEHRGHPGGDAPSEEGGQEQGQDDGLGVRGRVHTGLRFLSIAEATLKSF